MLEWSVNTLGGYLTTPELSQDMRQKAQSKQRIRNLVSVQEAFGLGKGDTLQYTKVGNAPNGRIVGETETVPTGNISFTKSSATCYEYTLGIDYTWRLEQLAKLDVYNQIVDALINSMARTLDAAAGAVCQTADLVYTPTGTQNDPTFTMGTAGVALAVATRPWSVYDHRNVIDLMAGTYNMPYYDDVGYVACGCTSFKRAFEEDGTWERLITPQNAGRAFRGEVGELSECRIVHETNVLSNAIGLNGVCGEAIYFAADAVMEIVVMPEEIQAKLGADYGRDKGMRWVFYGTWAKTFSYAQEQEARMIRVYSL